MIAGSPICAAPTAAAMPQAPDNPTEAYDVRTHPIHRDGDEKYLVVLGRGDIRVYDATNGNQAIINATTDATNYLASGNPSANEMRAASVGDTTVILNTLAKATLEDLTESYAVTRVFDTYTKMASRVPMPDQYFETTVDDGPNIAGFHQYVVDGASNGWARWDRGSVIGQWQQPTNAWDDSGKNPQGFRVRFKRNASVSISNATFDAVGHADGNRALTLAGAFTNYTFQSGDEIYITDGLPEGYYPISNRVDNNTILLTQGTSSADTRYYTTGDVRSDYSGGDQVGNVDASAYTVSGEATANFNTTAAIDIDDVMERFQTSLRSNSGLEEAIVYWDDSVSGPAIVSPFRGSNTTVIGIHSPHTGGHGDRSTGANGVFNFSMGTASAGTGSPTSDKEAIADRWIKVSAPSETNARLDATTMPVKLTRTQRNPTLIFELDLIDWKDRLSGNATTNPPPGIMVHSNGTPKQQTLSDIAFYQNRLAVSAGETVSFSQSGDLFNFFNGDANNVVESDPVDVVLSTSQVTLTDFMVPYRDSLMVFTLAGRQFQISGQISATETPQYSPATEYGTTPNVRPVRMHDHAFFTVPMGDRSALFSYRFSESSVSSRADNVSKHILQSLPVDIKGLAVYPDGGMIFVLPANSSAIWAYTQFIQSDDRVQIAWGPLSIDSTQLIDDIDVIGDELFLLINDTREGVRILEKINLAHLIGDVDLTGGQALPILSCS